MQLTIVSIILFLSTFLGGLFSLKYKENLHKIMGFIAGVLMGVVFFEILPEIIDLIKINDFDSTGPMVAIAFGFILFHILEKSILLNHNHDEEYKEHKHPHVGIASAIALAIHSFMDGIGIGLAFQINPSIGILVAAAVITHDFADGMNTVSLVLTNENSVQRAVWFLFLTSITPVLGIISTSFFTLPIHFLILYLGFFAGFLIYIASGDILPEAHSKDSSYKTIGLTILGLLLIFTVSRFI